MSGKFCSFCGRIESDVNNLIAGPDVYICDLCVDNATNILEFETELKEANFFEEFKNIKPKNLKKNLDKYVISQSDAKKILSVAVYNHYKRMQNNFLNNDVEISKNNVLMVGPTGVGKTLLVKTLTKILNIPFAIADATSLTEAGYVGDDVETIITRLIDSAGGDIDLAERGIIYIDEIDKISQKNRNSSITRDVSGEGVQQALLKIIEGTEASVPLTLGRKNPNQEQVKINTENILFIVGGAFSGIENIVEERFKEKKMGFLQNSKKTPEKNNEIYKNIIDEDIINYGLIPEFVGRLSNIAILEHLTETEYRKILTQPKNALIKQYIKLFEMEDIKLTFKPNAIAKVAQICTDKKIGARGLNSILDKMMNELMFEVPSNKNIEEIIIDADVILNKKQPIIIFKKGQKSA